ncbi:hypothetical protein ACIRBX_04005 [Kitasatospora sp. NPDC096147]|uniref:hypothetical protein n=1 Tax=Kitasatospora sp. NPDC096147 TaxID=3364093 RepID=UPI003828A46D
MAYSSHLSFGPDDEPAGPLPPARAEPGRWPRLAAALAVVNRDLTTSLLGLEGLVFMVRRAGSGSPSGGHGSEQPYLAMAAGSPFGEPVDPDGAEPFLLRVAEAVQQTVMEELRLVWPACPAHRIGLHPRSADQAVVWWCGSGGGHEHSPVGALEADAAPLELPD